MRRGITVDRLRRLQQLNVLLLHGGYSTYELAARFGVTQQTIKKDREIVERLWWNGDDKDKDSLRRRRVLELEQIKRLALESYHRSRKDHETIKTNYETRTCTECQGTGRLPKCRCLNCDGTGAVVEEKVTRQVSGQAGDAKFLKVAMDAVREMCRLEGIEAPKVGLVKVLDDRVGWARDKSLSSVDPDKVIEARVLSIEHHGADDGVGEVDEKG